MSYKHKITKTEILVVEDILNMNEESDSAYLSAKPRNEIWQR
jgi:hypothetical protein